MKKSDKICARLSWWDPLDFKGRAGPRFYNYEAEVLAQSVRKNSRVESVCWKLRELIEEKMRLEGVEDVAIDEEILRQMSVAMIDAVKTK